MTTTPPAMAEALARLWTRFLPEIDNRLALIEAAVRALAASELTVADRESAHQAAHKLAGVLGTFGLHRGTELARKIEHSFAEESPSANLAELSLWVAELRATIDSRK